MTRLKDKPATTIGLTFAMLSMMAVLTILTVLAGDGPSSAQSVLIEGRYAAEPLFRAGPVVTLPL